MPTAPRPDGDGPRRYGHFADLRHRRRCLAMQADATLVGMKITIESNSGAFEFECAPTERILRAGLVQGVALPYECATGTCGTCRGRMTAGSANVEWDAAPGYAKLKRDKGDILMCQA